MATPSERHEVHCAKRYLEYVETPFYRAFRDKDNPESDLSNYAVLKRMEDAEESLAEVEHFYAEIGVQPKFFWSPDSVPLDRARIFFQTHGYRVETHITQRMMLLTHTSPDLIVRKCPVREFTGGTLSGMEAQLVRESYGGRDFGLRLIDKQLRAGARAFFAYNRAEMPVCYCVGEGYGTAYELSDVYTDEHYRRQGFAAAAILPLLGYARDPENSYTDVFLYASDPDAIRLYEKFGFRGTLVEQYFAYKGAAPQADEAKAGQ